MTEVLARTKKALDNERGDILQLIIVLVVVVAIAIGIMPKIANKVMAQGEKSVTRLGDLDTIITNGTVN